MALADGLDIKLNAAVRKVEYNNRGVEVTVYNPKSPSSTNTYHGVYSYIVISIYKKQTLIKYGSYNNNYMFPSTY